MMTLEEYAMDVDKTIIEAQKKEYLMKHSNHEYLLSFMKRTKENTEKPWTSTGIESLDRIIDNGLYPGLYTIGAVSSLGKTSFALQIADQIAEAGEDVLFFSLEQSRLELVSKSLVMQIIQILAAYFQVYCFGEV